jgi:mRNA interferase HigB
MRVVGRKRLDDFARQHAPARPLVAAWVAEVETADWKGPQDIKDRYATASFLGGNQVVFNLGGNKYRLLVVVTYANGIVAVKRVGTHEEYNRWDLR